MLKEFPVEYDFYPKTWTFPYDKTLFLKFYQVIYLNNSIYIIELKKRKNKLNLYSKANQLKLRTWYILI